MFRNEFLMKKKHDFWKARWCFNFFCGKRCDSNELSNLRIYALLTLSSVDRAPAWCSGGHGFNSCWVLRFFLCPALVSCWSIHLSHFITELKIHHLYSLVITHDDFDGADPSSVQDACPNSCHVDHSVHLWQPKTVAKCICEVQSCSNLSMCYPLLNYALGMYGGIKCTKIITTG